MTDTQATQYSLMDALVRLKIAGSKGQAKRLCIQCAITVNGVVERDYMRAVSYRDEIRKGKCG